MTTSVTKDRTVATSFAWLGYGTFLRRDTVVSFLTHLARLNLSEEETRMADNYFSILYNRIAEIWFDHNIPLGGGTPFTVGSEGEARNNRHMVRPFVCLSLYHSHPITSPPIWSDECTPLPPPQ